MTTDDTQSGSTKYNPEYSNRTFNEGVGKPAEFDIDLRQVRRDAVRRVNEMTNRVRQELKGHKEAP